MLDDKVEQMDLSILDWFVVIVVLLVLVVLLDGYRRAQRSRRNQVRLSKNAKRMAKKGASEADDELSSPSSNMVGQPRVLREPSVDVPNSFGSALDDHDMSHDGGIEACPFMSGQMDETNQPSVDNETIANIDETMLSDAPVTDQPSVNPQEEEALDPLFIDPIKAQKLAGLDGMPHSPISMQEPPQRSSRQE